jgi:NarL family two-component system response regulator LiaR
MQMVEAKTIRVLIVDDHPLVRDGLKNALLITDDMEVIGEATSGEAAVLQCQQRTPDVVLMDIAMPGMNGIEATRKIASQFPAVKIVMLTTFLEDDFIQQALTAGAIGFLLKNTPADSVIGAIRAAHSGESVLSSEATQALIKMQTGSLSLGHDLSPREKEVLALMIEGLTNDEIAEQLVISLGTVRHHVSACISKLGAANRTHAVALAVEHQLTQRADGRTSGG